MDYQEVIREDDEHLQHLGERLTEDQLQRLLQDFENARAAFLELVTKSPVPVPTARVIAAQKLIRQTQDAIRAAFRSTAEP